MTAEENTAGASFHGVTDWHDIDWHAANRNVRRLQARIVQAIQARRWGKVKALQHLLTHSFSAKALAIRRVTENPGKHTPGVDQVLWTTPGEESGGDCHSPTARLPGPTAAAGVDPQAQWQDASSGHFDHAGSGYAGL